MITEKFIAKIHCYFDELNYRVKDELDYDDFYDKAIHTITHSEELIDAIEAVKIFRFCDKKWNKIEKVFDRYLDRYNQYNYEGNSLINMVSDEDAVGQIFITNALSNKPKDIDICYYGMYDDSQDEVYAAILEKGKFRAFEDGNYYLKYSNLDAGKMKIFDNDNNCLCNVVLSESYDIFLQNNLTDYELVIYDTGIAIYDKKYYDSLADDDIFDTEKILADIEWDIIKESSDYGVAKINFYQTNLDVEMIQLLGMSTFLTYMNFQQFQSCMRASRIGLLASRVNQANRL